MGQGNVSLQELDNITVDRGKVRAAIIDGKIRVLEAKHLFDDHRKKALVMLYSIHRAISNTRTTQDHNLWLMPDFRFWSWYLDELGTIDDVADQITREETTIGWECEIRKLIWKGKPQMLPKLQ